MILKFELKICQNTVDYYCLKHLYFKVHVPSSVKEHSLDTTVFLFFLRFLDIYN